jgi:DNA polymerase III alpha subunit
MRKDSCDRIILNEQDIIHQLMVDPDHVFTRPVLVEDVISLHPDLELDPIGQFVINTDSIDKNQFDELNRHDWKMPEKYKTLDIASWVLSQCTTEHELQRVGQELMMYLDRGLFPMLQYLKFLVDTMREHGIIWGVGRGSSVCSYVLFLIGIHKIDSIYYDLDINEFLR